MYTMDKSYGCTQNKHLISIRLLDQTLILYDPIYTWTLTWACLNIVSRLNVMEIFGYWSKIKIGEDKVHMKPNSARFSLSELEEPDPKIEFTYYNDFTFTSSAISEAYDIKVRENLPNTNSENMTKNWRNGHIKFKLRS